MGVLRRLGRALILAVGWMIGWAAFGAMLALVVGRLDPETIDPGEGPAVFARTLGGVGALCGFLFGLLLTVMERRRPLHEVSLLRAQIWGFVAGVSVPLLSSGIEDSVIPNTALLGILSGLVSAVVARGIRRVPRTGDVAEVEEPA